jgi:hypothetical protein
MSCGLTLGSVLNAKSAKSVVKRAMMYVPQSALSLSVVHGDFAGTYIIL